MGFDSGLAGWLNDWANHSGMLKQMSIWASSDLTFIFAATLVAGILATAAVQLRRRTLSFRLVEGSATTLTALALGMSANQVIGHIWHRPRPFDSVASVHLLVPPSHDPSFPSDHATAAFCLAIGVGFALPWLRKLLLAEAIVLVAGRVAVGLHYPSDIIAGLLVALPSVAAAQWLVYQIRRLLRRAAVLTLGAIVTIGPLSESSGWGRGYSFTLGAYAVVVGFPMVIEIAADPIRIRPEWLEASLLSALWLGLGGTAWLISRSLASFGQTERV